MKYDEISEKQRNKVKYDEIKWNTTKLSEIRRN